MEKVCLQCGNVFQKVSSDSKTYFKKRKYCSQGCSIIAIKPPSRLGYKNLEEHRKKISIANTGRIQSDQEKRKRAMSLLGNKSRTGMKNSEEAKLRVSKALTGIKRPYLVGENNPRWVKDRTKLKISYLEDYNKEYQEWMFAVKNRDNWKCKINNIDCKGQLEAHHILPKRDYPELRYEVNNGITLCHFHHPRKHKEESRLSSYFKQLIV